MAIYFFNLITAGHHVQDPDGQELSSLNEAIETAELSLCEIAGETLKAGSALELEALIITDDRGQELARVTTEDAVLPRLNVAAKSSRR